VRIKLDEIITVEAKEPLLAAGHDVDTVIVEHLAGHPDPFKLSPGPRFLEVPERPVEVGAVGEKLDDEGARQRETVSRGRGAVARS